MVALSRREQNKLQTRQRIIAAAKSMFETQGIDDTTVGEVARQAGVSRGTFFNYFPTKTAVLTAMWQDMTTQFARVVDASLSAQMSTRQRIHGIFEKFAHGAEVDPDYLMIVSGELNRDLCTGETPAARAQQLSEQILRIIEVGQAAGEVRTDLTASFLAQMVAAGYISAIMRWRDDPKVRPHKDFTATANFLADSIEPRPPHLAETSVMTSTIDHSVALSALLDGRFSCRAYKPEPVERATIERILELAQRTPSWCNTQPWHVAITEGEGTERFRTGLSKYVRSQPQAPDFEFPREYVGEYRERRLETALALYDSVGITRGDRAASGAQTMKNFDLFGAPHVAIITTDEALGVYGAVDCGLYVNTFLLAAQALGLGAIPQAALAGSSPYLREFFDLPEGRKVVCAISFGYPDEEHAVNNFRTTRVDIADAASWFSS